MPNNKEQELWEASEAGEADRVAVLLQDPGLDLAWEDPQLNQTAIYAAAQGGHLQIVKMFLKDGRAKISNKNYFEGPLHAACSQGHLDVVNELLLDPRIDVNQQDVNKFTPLCLACQGGHLQVVQRMLRDPRVDRNCQQFLGATPFFIVCREGHTEIVKELLRDGKVDPNKVDNFNTSPLYVAALMGHVEVVKWILASDREIQTTTRRLGRTTAIEISHEKNNLAIAALLKEFEANPQSTRSSLQLQLRISDRKASDVFATFVMLCDGYLRLNDQTTAHSPRLRFFKIARRLPMDLQMVLANRLYDLNKAFVPVRSSETSLRDIFRDY